MFSAARITGTRSLTTKLWPASRIPVLTHTIMAEASKNSTKLSPQEFRLYNSMADRMERFHNHFRASWTTLYQACETGKRPQGMSIRQFLTLGREFCEHLIAHHSFEERYVFPVLATKMPAFRNEVEMPAQHKIIHAGVTKFERYLGECQRGEKDMRFEDMKAVMDQDGFGKVLWQHLDDEVKQLGAENMKKYWSAAEMRRLGGG